MALCAAKAQTVELAPVPIQQYFSNSGFPLAGGAIYVYTAGTLTAAPTYTSSTGQTQNPNPIILDAYGRAPQIWLSSGYYKFVLCVQNDGSSCAAGDTIYTVDNIPGEPSSAGGGSSFTGTFTSATSTPATAGVLRNASGDQGVCWRNAANTANLCWSTNGHDLLSWSNGSLLFPEVAAPTGVASDDLLWADSTAHRWSFSNNGGTADVVVGANTTDTFSNKTFNAAAAGNVLEINGTTVSGAAGSGNDLIFGTGVSGSGNVIEGASNVTTIDTAACTIGATCVYRPAHVAYSQVSVSDPPASTWTNAQSVPLAAGELNNLGHTIAIDASGYMASAASETGLVRVALCSVSGCGSGTVIVLDSSILGPSSTLSGTYEHLLVTTTATGASGAIQSNGVLLFSAFYPYDIEISPQTVDLTQTYYIQVQVQWPTQSASDTYTRQLLAVSTVQN